MGVAARAAGRLLVAFVVSAFALVATGFYIVLTPVFGCHGSDASSPPAEGSIGDLLCPRPAWVLHLVLGGVAVVVPWLALGPRPRWLDLRVAFAISSAAIFLLSLIGSAVQSWAEEVFVLPPLVVFAAAVALAARPRSQRAHE